MSVRTIFDLRSGKYGVTEDVDGTGRGSRLADALMAGSREEEHALRQALWRRQFTVHYQPVIDVGSGALVGAEALLRWPRGDTIVPAERIIGLAERSGLVLRLGASVLHSVAAFRAASGLPTDGGLRFGINVSSTELLHPDFVGTVREVLEMTALAPEALEIEVSERTVAEAEPHATATMGALWELGVACTLDDLGSSSLSGERLRALPILSAKVDLPSALRTEEALSSHMRAIDLAQSLGITVIAKRVARYDELELLSWLELTRAQGFAFGAPVPATVFRGLLVDAGLIPARRANGAAPNGRVPRASVPPRRRRRVTRPAAPTHVPGA